MTASPIAWSTVQSALRAWVVGATELADASVLWQAPDQPQRPRPYAWLAILSGPRPLGQIERRRSSQIQRERVNVTVQAAGNYTATVYEANPTDAGTPYVGSGGTLTAIRDALRTAIAAGEPDLVLANVGADAFTIEGTAGRPHFHLQVSAPVGGGITRTIEQDAILETTYEPVELTVRVQAETASQLPASHARDLLARARAALGQGPVLVALRTAGVAYLRAEPPIDLTQLVGDAQVSRMSQDFTFGVGAQVDRQPPWARSYTATASPAISA